MPKSRSSDRKRTTPVFQPAKGRINFTDKLSLSVKPRPKVTKPKKSKIGLKFEVKF